MRAWRAPALRRHGNPRPSTAGPPRARPASRAPWSTGAVSALSEYVLGIRPAAPGYARWLIQPQVGNLRFSQGRLPTPHGALVSRWSRGPRNRWLRLTAGGARGTIGTVAVPELGAARTIAMDGRVVRRNRRRAPGVSAHRRGDTVFFDHITGTHTFAWRSGHAPPIVD